MDRNENNNDVTQETNDSESETADTVESSDSKKVPTVEETIRASIAELKGASDDSVDENKDSESDANDDSLSSETESVEEKEDSKTSEEINLARADKKDAKISTQSQRIEPPARWPVAKKEWFNKQPKEAQEEISKGWNEIESHATKVFQEAAREKQSAANVNKILSHYRSEWGLKGITDEQAIAELCATQDNINKNPVETIALIMKKRGVSPQALANYLSGNGETRQMSNLPPEFNELTKTVKELKDSLSSREQAFHEQQLQQAVAEVEGVMRETNAQGQYLYPELWEETYRERAKPLVEDLRKTHGLSWSEATRKAINVIRQIDGRPSPSSNGSRLSTRDELQKVKAASVSIKSRGSATIPTRTPAKAGESVRETLERTYAELSRQ